MSARNAARKEFNGEATIKDPGNAGHIVIDKSPVTVNMISAAAESRTLDRPTRMGAIVSLHMQTDGGDITITVTGGYNQSGATSLVFQAEGQVAVLESFRTKAGVYFWKLIRGDGVIETASNLVTVTTSPLTLTPEAHGNKTVVLSLATGIAVTLPAATGSGITYTIVIGITITSTNVTTITGVGLNGQIYQLQDGGDTIKAYELADSTIITLGTSSDTTGGTKGDSIILKDVASGLWQVVGNTTAAGTEATPVT